MRLEKVSIPFLVQLENLRKLSLFMCKVSQAFENYSHQISDSLPNLVGINVDYCSDVVKLPNGLCDILSLRILRITNCHKLSALPEQIGDLENLEELKLNSCTDLEELPDSLGILHKLNNLDICQKSLYPKEMISNVKNWDWFNEEPRKDSEYDDDFEKKGRRGMRRKRKICEDNGDDGELVAIIRKVQRSKVLDKVKRQ
ncbi:Disease resistance protein [Quillaja saponaria]|uniref:Disease resistance protein n=1 Tax=Quillaja saponaria TaxID=32244 RepID=A0AAD7LRW3_QUISA|nr:Disease resistance protein [Quillaja saponaria]